MRGSNQRQVLTHASHGIGVDIVMMVVLARVKPRPARRLVGQHPQAM